MKIGLYLTIILLFLGCNAKHKIGYFDNKKNQQQAIIHTKKAQFSINQDRFLLSATYLNPIKSLHVKNSENFLVSIYSSNSKDDNIITRALLNGDGNIHWQKLDTNDSLSALSPISSKWSKFYLLKAPIQSEEKLKLTLEIRKTKPVVLNFEKSLLK